MNKKDLGPENSKADPYLEAIAEFNKLFDNYSNEKPTRNIPKDIEELRKTLLTEEADEVTAAMDNEDLASIAKELADLAYVLFGIVSAYGLADNFLQMYLEVHRSNLSKLDQNNKLILREDGKALKGPNYSPADMQKFLENSSD